MTEPCLVLCEQMQKLVRAAKHGTKDGLEKTKAAVKKGKSFIRTKSFGHGRRSSTSTLPLSCYFEAAFLFMLTWGQYRTTPPLISLL